MAECSTNMQHQEEEEEQIKVPEEGKNEENNGSSCCNSNKCTDTSEFLKDLNLILIVSFLSLSAEERLDFEAIKPKDLIKRPKSKSSISTLHACKQEMKVNEFRALERQTRRFQTKIRDCRQSRRM